MFPRRKLSPPLRSRNIQRDGRAYERSIGPRHSTLERLEARAMLSVEVTYHGNPFSGAVLRHVQVETVFLGPQWTSDPNLAADRQTMNNFFQFITRSPYMDLMGEYYESDALFGDLHVGRGSWTGQYVSPANPPTVITDSQIKSDLRSAISAGEVPYPNDYETLYFVFLPPGVNSAECAENHWGAYHSGFSDVVGYDQGLTIISNKTYAVVPWPGSYDPGWENSVQWQEIYSSHELAEAVTNPANAVGGFDFLGAAWYADGNQFADGQGRELADLAATPNLKFGKFDGYWVQALWSNISTDPNMPGDHRILPPGTTNIFAVGNGQGVFGSGKAGVGFNEVLDPLEGHLPTALPRTYATPARYFTGDGSLSIPASMGLLSGAADPNGLPLVARLLSGPSSGTVDLGSDGSFSYAPPYNFVGSDSFTIEVTDGEFQSNPVTIDVNVKPLMAMAAAGGLALTATEGQQFSGALATFTDPNGTGGPQSYFASVQWGDGGPPYTVNVTGPNENGLFTVSADKSIVDKSFVEEDPSPATVTVVIRRLGSPDTTVIDSVRSLDAPLTAIPETIAATEQTGFDATVATFRDVNGNAKASDFSATIDWGDGTTSTGEVSATAPGDFEIHDSHFYTQAGTKALYVVVQDIGGSSATITSTAYVQAGGTANGRYVEAVFENVLDRPADEDGWLYWTNKLAGGIPIGSVAESIAHSDEYYANFVIKPDYLTLLGRAADADGIAHWTAQMHNGLTDQQLEAQFAASDEFYKTAGGTNKDWGDAVYKLLLGRTADASGEAFWQARLAAGQTRLQVAQGIAGSTENNTQLINDDYFHLLGRAADPEGLSYWKRQFDNGATNEDVIASFTGSAEYYKEKTS